MDIAEFLLARIGEDEALAHHSIEGIRASAEADPSGNYGNPEERHDLWVNPSDGCGLWIGEGRVLAECEAKREIVENLRLADENGADAAWEAAAAIARVYAHHPDFNPRWRLIT
jgi:hypothetical protein